MRKYMISHCKRNVFLIFGGLFITAVLIVPYNSTRVTYRTDSYSRNKLRITTKKSGFLFLPRYLKIRAGKPRDLEPKSFRFRDEDIEWSMYRFNTKLFIIEIVIIILAAGFDYIIFCVVLRRSRGKG